MPAYRVEANALLEDRDRVADELASVTTRWKEARASGSHLAELRAQTMRMAALNQRLDQIEAELVAFEISTER